MKRSCLMVIFLSIAIFCSAQKLAFTPEGLRSSIKTSDKIVEYKSLGLEQEALYKHCVSELEKIQYVQYSFDRKTGKEITLYGYIESPSFLIFGVTSIRFIMQFTFIGDKVQIGVDLTKSNGKEINYGRLYNKKREVRVPMAKNKIEEELNLIITNVLGPKVSIE